MSIDGSHECQCGRLCLGRTPSPKLELPQEVQKFVDAEAKRIIADRDCDCGADDGGDRSVDICSAHRVLANLSAAFIRRIAGEESRG